MAPTTLSRRDLIRAKARADRAGTNTAQEVPWRPQTRADCQVGPRPCPYVGCRYHVFLEAKRNGGIKLPHGEEVDVLDRLPYTCSLDAAEAGGLTLDQVAKLMGITRERVRQIEEVAHRHFLNACQRLGWGDALPPKGQRK